MSGTVNMKDDNPLSVEGIGDIRLRMFDGIIRNIECWHVPWIKRNLISLSTLDDQGYKFHSENGILKVCKGSMVLMKGKLHSKLYHLQDRVVEGEAVVASGKDYLNQSQLWHLRLGHMIDKGLSVLSKQNLLDGYKNQVLNFSKHYVFDKQTRVKFSKKAEHKTRDKLDYIYSDLWGPNRVPSKNGARYFIILIDDYSMMV
ncbi:putative mitochondrial protein AtMg00300 [Nicotiana tabacum]|uniref:Mitochondrial protein AtMg00300 n=1 Tax=Nicotiana tabacum TaxID=4097 RepID=A0AC58SJ01_TOBAC